MDRWSEQFAADQQNLCELWNAVSPVPYVACEFHYVLVAGWFLAAVVMVIILATRSTIWVRQVALPHGGIRPLGKHWYSRFAPYVAPHAARLRPLHVIALGLTIALIGVVWQWWRADPTNSDLQAQVAKQVAPLKTELTGVRQQLKEKTDEAARFQQQVESLRRETAVSRPSTNRPTSGLRLTGHDLRQRQEAIDDFDKWLNEYGNSAARIGFTALEKWNDGEGRHSKYPNLIFGPREFLEDTTAFWQSLVRYFERHAELYEKHRTFEVDIYNAVVRKEIDNEIISWAQRFRNELQRIIAANPNSNAPALLISNNVLENWRTTLGKFSDRVNQTRYELRQLRKRYGEADIIPEGKR